jgi:hypothetical protein
MSELNVNEVKDVLNEFSGEMVDPEFYESNKDDDTDEPLVESPKEVVEDIFEEYETPSIEELSKLEEENDNVEYIKEYPFQDNLDQVPVEEDTEEDRQVFHETQEVKNKDVEDYYEFLIKKFNELFSLGVDDAINILSDTDGPVSKNGFLFSRIVRAQLLGTFKGYLLSKNIVDAELIVDIDVRRYLKRYYYDFKDYITNRFVEVEK